MYKVVAAKVRVELESPDGNAILTFKKAKLNELLDSQSKLDSTSNQIDRVRLSFEQVLSRLISVEDMQDENGEPVTAERIKALDFDPVTMNAIVEGYNIALGIDAKPKAEEKKD